MGIDFFRTCRQCPTLNALHCQKRRRRKCRADLFQRIRKDCAIFADARNLYTQKPKLIPQEKLLQEVSAFFIYSKSLRIKNKLMECDNVTCTPHDRIFDLTTVTSNNYQNDFAQQCWVYDIISQTPGPGVGPTGPVPQGLPPAGATDLWNCMAFSRDGVYQNDGGNGTCEGTPGDFPNQLNNCEFDPTKQGHPWWLQTYTSYVSYGDGVPVPIPHNRDTGNYSLSCCLPWANTCQDFIDMLLNVPIPDKSSKGPFYTRRNGALLPFTEREAYDKVGEFCYDASVKQQQTLYSVTRFFCQNIPDNLSYSHNTLELFGTSVSADCCLGNIPAGSPGCPLESSCVQSAYCNETLSSFILNPVLESFSQINDYFTQSQNFLTIPGEEYQGTYPASTDVYLKGVVEYCDGINNPEANCSGVVEGFLFNRILPTISIDSAPGGNAYSALVNIQNLTPRQIDNITATTDLDQRLTVSPSLFSLAPNQSLLLTVTINTVSVLQYTLTSITTYISSGMNIDPVNECKDRNITTQTNGGVTTRTMNTDAPPLTVYPRAPKCYPGDDDLGITQNGVLLPPVGLERDLNSCLNATVNNPAFLYLYGLKIPAGGQYFCNLDILLYPLCRAGNWPRTVTCYDGVDAVLPSGHALPYIFQGNCCFPDNDISHRIGICQYSSFTLYNLTTTRLCQTEAFDQRPVYLSVVGSDLDRADYPVLGGFYAYYGSQFNDNVSMELNTLQIFPFA